MSGRLTYDSNADLNTLIIIIIITLLLNLSENQS